MKNIKFKKNMIKVLRGSVLLVVFIVLGIPVYGELDSDTKRLEQGKPVIKIERDGSHRKTEGKILINVNIDECWKATADLDGMADWAPGMIYSRTVGKDGDNTIAMFGGKVLWFTVHVPEALVLDEENKTIVGQQLSSEDVAKYNKTRGWDLVEANYTNDYKEEYKLEAYGEDKTIMHYTVAAELKYSIPKAAEDFFCKLTVPPILKAAKKAFEAYALENYSKQVTQTP